MNNFVEYFYNIKVKSVVFSDKCYTFIHSGYLHKIYYIDYSYDQIKELYDINRALISNTLMSEILINKFNNIVSYYNNANYILIKIYVNINKKISLDEIIILSNTSYKNNMTINWGKLWSNKIDYLEDLINENGKKYPIIVDSFNYFVGMCENAISYFNSINIDVNYKYAICHKKIWGENTIECLYNPLNIIFDFRVRDVAEYLKNAFFIQNNNVLCELDIYLNQAHLSLFEVKLLISRLLYPSFYFELYEDIFINEKDEKILINIISKLNDYEAYLYNIIYFLKNRYNVDEINWLKSK